MMIGSKTDEIDEIAPWQYFYYSEGELSYSGVYLERLTGLVLYCDLLWIVCWQSVLIYQLEEVDIFDRVG